MNVGTKKGISFQQIKGIGLIMGTFEKLIDPKKYLPAKIIACIVTLTLVFGFVQFSAFAGNEEKAGSDVVSVESVESSADETENAPSVPDTDTSKANEATNTEADSATSTSAADETKDVVDVALSMTNAYITVKATGGVEQTVPTQATKVSASTTKDLEFVAYANEGYELSKVEATNADGAKVTLTNKGDGTYVVAKSDIKAGLKITVVAQKASAQDEKQATEPAATTEETQQEQAAPEPNAQEAVVTYPAFKNSTTVGGFLGLFGVNVTVTANEGVVPEGTKVVANAVSGSAGLEKAINTVEANGRSVVDTTVIDVKLVDASGTEVQPNGTVTVSFANNGVSGQHIDVFHVDNGEAEYVSASEATASNTVFATTHFSEYALVGSDSQQTYDPAAMKTVNVSFVYDNGSSAAPTYSPALPADAAGNIDFTYEVPAIEGFTVALGEGTPEGVELVTETDAETGIEKSILTYKGIVSGDSLDITVVYTGKQADINVYHLFQNADGSYPEKASDNLQVVKGYVGALSTVEAQKIEGFTAEDFDQIVVSETETNEVVINYARNTYYVTYNTEGGSYIPAKSALYGSDVEVYKGTAGSESVQTCGMEEHAHTAKPDPKAKNHKNETIGCYTSIKQGDSWKWVLTCGKEAHVHNSDCHSAEVPASYDPAPTKQGYTFAGWYSDPECTIPADTTISAISADAVVYAKWNPQEVSYTIVNLQEVWDNSTNSSYYAFKSSKSSSALVGSTVSATSDGDQTNYTYRVGDSVVVKADGSTVVYGYYDLTRYTLVFNLNKDNASISYDGKEYKGSEYTINNVVLGMDVSALWPSTDTSSSCPKINEPKSGDKKYFYIWGNNYLTKRFEVTADMLKANGGNQTLSGTTVTYKGTWTDDTSTLNVEYWLQNADGKGYTKSDTYSQTNLRTDTLDPKNIYGFTKVNTPSGYNGSSNTTKRFYYNRNSVELSFFNGDNSNPVKTETILFGADISGKYYKPNRPAGIDPEATFGGWYDNPACTGDPYTFTTMPANNLALYAQWVVPTKNVTFIYNNGTDNTVIKVEKGSKVSEIPNPTREGFIFGGWYTNEGCTTAFDPNAPITSDTTVYAKWTPTNILPYTVKYVNVDTGSEIAPAKNANGKIGSPVVEYAISIDGYISDAYSKSLTIVNPDENDGAKNEIVFNYRSTSATSDYKIQYVDENGNVLKDTDWAKATNNPFIPQLNQTIIHEINEMGYNVDLNLVPVTLVAGTQPAANIITIKCTPKQYTINYDLNGGSFASDANHPATYTVNDFKNGKTITISNPTKEGYTFTGWVLGENTTINGDAATAGTNVGKDLVLTAGTHGNLNLTATWSADEGYYNYELVYNTAGGSAVAGDNATSTIEVRTHDFTATSDVPTKEGYTFTGWVDEDNNPVAAGATVTATIAEGAAKDTTATRTLTATWSADPAYIVFEENGGTEVSDMEGTTDETITNTDMPTTTRTGYTFAGWYDNADLTGDAVVNLPGAYPAGTTTYYAKWTANTDTKYTVEFYYMNADGTYPETATNSVERTGTTDTPVSVTDADKTPADGYTYDETAANIESGIIAGDGSLVLMLYFKATNPLLEVTKETTNANEDGTPFGLGDEITYKVTVANAGNLTVKNIVVTDELAGVKLTGGEETIASLAPGEKAELTYSYIVTEADILAGKVVNNATASGETPGGDPEIIPGTTEDPTEDPNGAVTVEKTVTNTPANGTNYLPGETIAYQIVVTNTGNLTIINTQVVDPLTGDTWTIDTLAPAESRTFEATHVVTEEEGAAGSVTNVATATGTTPDPNNPETTNEDEVTSTTEPTPVVPPTETPEPTTPAAEPTVLDQVVTALAGENIDEEGNPLTGFDHIGCWVHWYIIVGIILTAIYGVGVVARRKNYTNKLADIDNNITNGAAPGGTPENVNDGVTVSPVNN